MSTLGPLTNDSHSAERERLRVAFARLREHSATIASEIARDLPDFTVHDISHLDALWHTADLILGS